MFQVGEIKFNSIRDYYSEVMGKYFRRNPPVPTNIYLGGEVADSDALKIKIAQHCHFPSILNILANDESDLVTVAAKQNEFWHLVGRYQDILGFGKRERRAFARIEGHPNILVLLMFEDDPDVINEVLHNPTVSLQILVLFQQLLNERGTGRKDEQLQMIARSIITERREQIIKISEINKAAVQISKQENVGTILFYFTEKDITIHRAIENILAVQPAEIIRKFVNFALNEKHFKHLLDHFIVLSGLIEVLRKRDNLKQIPISALQIKSESKSTGPIHSVADFFINLLTKKRVQIVKRSVSNLTDFNNVILLTHCHIENENTLRTLAAEIMPLQDILGLVNDISTPRKVFKEILSILETHYDENVVEKVRDTFMLESRRMSNSLKELEITVQAYFDIIFQSLGYNKINEYLDVVRSINTTENQLAKFSHLIEGQVGTKQKKLNELLDSIKQALNENANVIYFDTGPKITKELESIFSILDDIFKLKDMGLNSLRPGTPQDIESEIRARARVIWQSAISVYLGRIKDLSEMIRKKILKAMGQDIKKNELELEIRSVEEDIEAAYKEKIQCNLTNACKVCGKRGCAAERFLEETHFFIEQYLDNFVEA